MFKTLGLAFTLIATPALGQTVYKCPQPDGAIKYQKARCPEGGRMSVQDNGTVTGPPNAVTVQPPTTKASSASSIAPNVAPNAPVRSRSVTDSQAWKGLDKIQAESTATINALQRLQRR